MGHLVEFFVKRPLLVNIIVIGVMAMGFFTAINMQKEGFPGVSINQIVITTIYPGASALDVEMNVTIAVEDALEEVAGVKEVYSISREAMSIVTVDVDDSASQAEFDRIYDDVDGAVSRIDDLPKDIEGQPVLNEITIDDRPIVEIALTGEAKRLKSYVPYLEDELRKISEVSQTVVVGLPDDEVHILVDPKLAKKRYVDLKLIAAAIQQRNLEGSGGTLESFISEKKIVIFSKFQRFLDVLDTNIRRSAEGKGVKLRDVATASIAPKDMKLLVRNNGKRGASILIKKKQSADALKTVDHVNEILEEYPPPEGVTVKLLNDQSYLTRNRLKLLRGNSILGFALVVLVLFLVFGFKTAIWTAFGIPFSLFGLFIVLPHLGISINALTLGACVLVLGMPHFLPRFPIWTSQDLRTQCKIKN